VVVGEPGVHVVIVNNTMMMVGDTASGSPATAADGTDSHRRYTGIPAVDDRNRFFNNGGGEQGEQELPKMSGPKDNDDEEEEEEEGETGLYDEDNETVNEGQIRTTESESVANGFVRDGSSLSYVFETNESGWSSLFMYAYFFNWQF
jgi:hypothetical protein